MSYSCPISFERVDAVTIRIATLLISMVVVSHIYFDSVWVIMLLVLDFMVRLYGNRRFSIVYLSAARLQKMLHLKSRYEDAAAKRLAAHFGLLFALLLLLTSSLNFAVAHTIIAIIFLSCAALEIAIGYCLGCKIYYVLKKYNLWFKA